MALPQVVLPTYELEIPSNGKKIKYRPFVVKEEKLLLIALETEDEKEIERAVKQLLKGCIQSRVKIEELPIFDLEYIFLQIRAVSVGEDIELMVTCRDDEKTQVKYHLNLSTVQVTKPKGHDTKIMLTDDLGVVMKYPAWTEFVTTSLWAKRQLRRVLLKLLLDVSTKFSMLRTFTTVLLPQRRNSLNL